MERCSSGLLQRAGSAWQRVFGMEYGLAGGREQHAALRTAESESDALRWEKVLELDVRVGVDGGAAVAYDDKLALYGGRTLLVIDSTTTEARIVPAPMQPRRGADLRRLDGFLVVHSGVLVPDGYRVADSHAWRERDDRWLSVPAEAEMWPTVHHSLDRVQSAGLILFGGQRYDGEA